MHHLLGGPWATPSRIIRIRSTEAGTMDKQFCHFFTFLPSRDQKTPQGNQGKSSQRTSGKNPGKSYTLSAHHNQICNIYSGIIFLGYRGLSSWIFRTKSYGVGARDIANITTHRGSTLINSVHQTSKLNRVIIKLVLHVSQN
jgi:hypothetical protein